RERCRAFERRAGLVEAAEVGEEVAAHTRHEMVALERRLRGQRIDELEAGLGTEGHAPRASLRPELSIPRVAEAGHDVAMFVEMTVDGCQMERHVGMG